MIHRNSWQMNRCCLLFWMTVQSWCALLHSVHVRDCNSMNWGYTINLKFSHSSMTSADLKRAHCCYFARTHARTCTPTRPAISLVPFGGRGWWNWRPGCDTMVSPQDHYLFFCMSSGYVHKKPFHSYKTVLCVCVCVTEWVSETLPVCINLDNRLCV